MKTFFLTACTFVYCANLLSMEFVTRDAWGAKEMNYSKYRPHTGEIDALIISTHAKENNDAVATVQAMQQEDLEEGLFDIRCNYCIDLEGNRCFSARPFNCRPDGFEKDNNGEGICSIIVLGNFSNDGDEIDASMVNKFGKQLGRIAKEASVTKLNHYGNSNIFLRSERDSYQPSDKKLKDRFDEIIRVANDFLILTAREYL